MVINAECKRIPRGRRFESVSGLTSVRRIAPEATVHGNAGNFFCRVAPLLLPRGGQV